MDVLGIFLQQKRIINSQTGKHLSKIKRMDEMYDVIKNKNYNHKFTKDEQLLAADLIKEIIKEN